MVDILDVCMSFTNIFRYSVCLNHVSTCEVSCHFHFISEEAQKWLVPKFGSLRGFVTKIWYKSALALSFVTKIWYKSALALSKGSELQRWIIAFRQDDLYC